MSLTSYNDKISKGLIHPEMPICMPTAFDHLLFKEIDITTYLVCIGAVAIDGTPVSKATKNSAINVAYDHIARDAGLGSRKDIEFEAITSADSLRKYVNKCRRIGHGVILDIAAPHDETDLPDDYDPLMDAHAVGVVPITGYLLRLTSTWVPAKLQGAITYNDLWPSMLQQKDKKWSRFPFNHANTTSIPML